MALQHRTARERAAHANGKAATARAWARALGTTGPAAPVDEPPVADQVPAEAPWPPSPSAWRRRCQEIRVEIEEIRALRALRARMNGDGD